MSKFEVGKTFNKLTKNFKKMAIPELKMEEGKIMNKITDKENELKQLNETLIEIRKLIREKQQ
jgi:hypothetical protein